MKRSWRIGSLFSGIGGLELGLERAGLGTVAWQVEIEPYPRAVLEKHWPDAVRHTDVREVGAHNLSPVDVICGGFPCQDISNAGKRAGLDGARSGLWFEYLRIVRELRPLVVVAENVAALRTRGLPVVVAGLEDAGYRVVVHQVSAADVGAPHLRKRLFICAFRADAAVADASGVGLTGRKAATGGDDADGNQARRDKGTGGLVAGGDLVRPAVAGAAGELADAAEQPERESADATLAVAVGGDARDVSGRGGELADAPRGARLRRAPGDEGHPALGGEGVADARSARSAAGLSGPDARQEGLAGVALDGGDAATGRRRDRPAEPRVGRAPDGVPVRVDGAGGHASAVAAEARWPARPSEAPHPWEAPRTAVGVVKRADRLKGLGNAVVPRVAEAIGRWVVEELSDAP